MVRTTRLFGLFVLALAALARPSASQAQVAVGVSIRIGPPALPVYPQPVCPGAGYIWTPGYWAYGPAGYYWVPGTWVLASAGGRLAVDAGLLGLGRRRLCVARRLLGTARRLLWWN